MTEPKPPDTLVGSGLRAYRWLAVAIVIFFALIFAAAAIFLGPPMFACACSSTAQPPDVQPSPVVGVVVGIEQVSLTQVNSFEIRTSDGKTYTLKVGPLDNATQFSLSHLATHMATGLPIRASYRLENGQPVVYHLEDAVPASPALNPT